MINKTTLVKIGRYFGFMAGAVIVLLTSFLILLDTSFGRRQTVKLIEKAINSQIAGSLHIGKLEWMSWGHPHVVNLEFRHPNQSRVIHVRSAEIDLDMSRLLGGVIAFDSARVHGGTVVIAMQPDDRTTIEGTFDSPKTAETKGTENNFAELDLRAIQVQGVDLPIRLSEDTMFSIEKIQGFIAIKQLSRPGAIVRLSQMQGLVTEPELLGSKLRLQQVDGRIHGDVEHVLRLEIQSTLGEDPLNAHLEYYNRENTPVQLRLLPKGGIKTDLAAFSIQLATLFQRDIIDVTIN